MIILRAQKPMELTVAGLMQLSYANFIGVSIKSNQVIVKTNHIYENYDFFMFTDSAIIVFILCSA